MNAIDGTIVAAVASLLTVAVMLWHTQATDFASSAIGGVKKWLSGKKTHLASAALGGVSAWWLGSSYLEQHDAIAVMGASAIPPDMYNQIAGLLVAFLGSFLRMAIAKLSEEQKKNLEAALKFTEKLDKELRAILNMPSPPDEPDVSIFK